MRTVINTLAIICFGLVFSSSVMSMTPQEKAAAIKEWRANCSDPDPDLRLAYLEAAIDHHCNESAEIEPVNAKSEVQDVKIQQTIAQLTEDILKGRTLPVLRRIRAAGYALEIDVIRQVLSGLYDVGILEADKRNSYKLSESIQYLTKGKKKFAQ